MLCSESHLAKVDVEGSNPFSRSAFLTIFGRSLHPFLHPVRTTSSEQPRNFHQFSSHLVGPDRLVVLVHRLRLVPRHGLRRDLGHAGSSGRVLEGAAHGSRGDVVREPDHFTHVLEGLLVSGPCPVAALTTWEE